VAVARGAARGASDRVRRSRCWARDVGAVACVGAVRRASVVLLSGEPGIGKTRLAAYSALGANADGFGVCWLSVRSWSSMRRRRC